MSSHDNHRQAHSTPTAHNISTFAILFFKKNILPTYFVLHYCAIAVERVGLIRWLVTVSSTFQDLEFDGSF